MGTLSNAPLVEALFEIRWGKHTQQQAGGETVQFADEDNLFFGNFKSLAARHGFVHFERINKNVPLIFPYTVTMRFRKEEGTWPCMQLGQGVFTVNQINDGYEWEKFKVDILAALEIFIESYDNIDNLPVRYIELKYQDGFVRDEDVSTYDFLREKFKIKFEVSSEYITQLSEDGKIRGLNMAFNLRLDNPKGILIFDLKEALISGEEGFVSQTIVRSAKDDVPLIEPSSISEWLESAHDVQRKAFKEFIEQAYLEKFL